MREIIIYTILNIFLLIVDTINHIYKKLINLKLIIFLYSPYIFFSKIVSNEYKTIKYTILKTFGHFSVTNVDSIDELSLSIQVFVYFKTENIW